MDGRNRRGQSIDLEREREREREDCNAYLLNGDCTPCTKTVLRVFGLRMSQNRHRLPSPNLVRLIARKLVVLMYRMLRKSVEDNGCLGASDKVVHYQRA